MATKFQRLHPCFRGQTTGIDYWAYFPMSWYVLNQRWWPLQDVYVILRMSQLVNMIAKKFQRLQPCLWGQTTGLDY